MLHLECGSNDRTAQESVVRELHLSERSYARLRRRLLVRKNHRGGAMRGACHAAA